MLTIRNYFIYITIVILQKSAVRVSKKIDFVAYNIWIRNGISYLVNNLVLALFASGLKWNQIRPCLYLFNEHLYWLLFCTNWHVHSFMSNVIYTQFIIKPYLWLHSSSKFFQYLIQFILMNIPRCALIFNRDSINPLLLIMYLNGGKFTYFYLKKNW